MKHYTLKIIGLRKKTADTLTVVFKQPGLKKIQYQAGQYLTLIFHMFILYYYHRVRHTRSVN